MATKTLHRIISGENEVAAVLSNSTLRRLLSIGSTWTRLRIALRLRWQDSGADITSNPMFVVGVCSGVAAPYNNGSGSTTHFFGFYENAATLTRYAAAGANPAYYRGALNTGASLRRVGTTNAAYGGPLHYAWYWMTGNRTLCFLDIRKNTSPTAWEVMLHCKSSVDNYDATYADFINCATLDTFNFQGHSQYSWRSSVSATPNEATNGYFDAVNISWDRSNPKVEISDLAVVRFA